MAEFLSLVMACVIFVMAQHYNSFGFSDGLKIKRSRLKTTNKMLANFMKIL